MVDVKIKRKQSVKPSEATWEGVMRLSELDQVVGEVYAPTIYLYSKPSCGWSGSMIETLKDALSRALVHYYPLAGRLSKGSDQRLELHCNAHGVELIEAESTSRLQDLGDFSASHDFCHLIPLVDYDCPLMDRPLFLAQLTHFTCGGACLALMISHTIVDGAAALYFVNDWARLARGAPIEELPCHDRSLLKAGEPTKDAHQYKYMESELSSLLLAHQTEQSKVETDMAMLTLSAAQVEKLKRAANERATEQCRRPYSRYEAIAAHIWRCTSKARGHASDEQRALGIAIDARFRISNFPSKYFGNTAFVTPARGMAGEIVSSPLSSTCQKIREAIEGVTEESIWSYIEFLKGLDDISIGQQLRAIRPGVESGYVNPNPGVISWLSIPVCGLDFGWGKELHMRPGNHQCDGVSTLVSGRKELGSVVVYMSLRLAHLDTFKKHFYHDIV